MKIKEGGSRVFAYNNNSLKCSLMILKTELDCIIYIIMEKKLPADLVFQQVMDALNPMLPLDLMLLQDDFLKNTSYKFSTNLK